MAAVKVVVLGAHGVGKTSIVRSFTGDIQPQHKLGADVYKLRYCIEKGRCRPVEIVDPCISFLGKLFRKDTRHQIRQGDAFIVVYAVDDVKSFCAAMDICLLVYKEKGSMDVPLVLLGNKSDLPCKVSEYRFLQLDDIPRLFTNGRSRENVNYGFDTLLDIVWKEEWKEAREKTRMERMNRTGQYSRNQSQSTDGNETDRRNKQNIWKHLVMHCLFD